VSALAGVAAVLFLIVAVVTGNYGAWATGAACLLVAALLAFLRARK
jgi:hypothetical protein